MLTLVSVKVPVQSSGSVVCVLGLQVYGRVYRIVEPKQALLQAATSQLEEKQAALAAAQNKLQEVELQPPPPHPPSRPTLPHSPLTLSLRWTAR